MPVGPLERLSEDRLYTVTGLRESDGPWIEVGRDQAPRRKRLTNWREMRIDRPRSAFETQELYEASVARNEAINALISATFSRVDTYAQHNDELIDAVISHAADLVVPDVNMTKLEEVRAAMHLGHREQLECYADELTSTIAATGMKLWVVAQRPASPDSDNGLAGRYVGVTVVGEKSDVRLEPVVQARGNTRQQGLLPSDYWPRPFPIYTD